MDGQRTPDWERRVASEFVECPGLRLTVGQAARFWGLDRATVEQILARLVSQRMLVRSIDGTFTRATDPRR